MELTHDYFNFVCLTVAEYWENVSFNSVTVNCYSLDTLEYVIRILDCSRMPSSHPMVTIVIGLSGVFR